MDNVMKLNADITVGPQPTETDIEELKHNGYKSIVNFRTNGEDDQPLSPEAERAAAEQHGMVYLHHPVAMDAISLGVVDAWRMQLAGLPKPIYAHCRTGKRAGAMAMMHMACERGMTGDETLEQAKHMGFECDQPQLEQFVKSYVDNCTTGSAAP